MDSLFFIVAKTGWLLVQPVTIMMVLMLLAMLAAIRGHRRLSVLFSGAGVLLIYVCAFTTAGSVLLAKLEDRYPASPDLDDGVAAIIVLGGGFDGSVTRARGGYALGSAGDRFTEVAMLAQDHPEAMIIVSGGTASFLEEMESDAVIAPRFFTRLGIDPGRLILEGQSDDTFENVKMTRPFLESVQAEREGAALLITSAFHMPRSISVFEAQGLDVIPWPVDFRTAGEGSWRAFDTHTMQNLNNTTIALREWLGSFAYRMTGRL